MMPITSKKCLSVSLSVGQENTTKAAMLNAWQQWAAKARPGAGEYRDVAVERLQDYLEQQAVELDLSGLGLTALPALFPADLPALDISNNQLTYLPDNLPDSLQTLDVSDNQLTRLPELLPVSLTELNVDNNQLTHLPDNLPNSLETLDVNSNQLTHLPRRLPPSLQRLSARHNQLVDLPDHFPHLLEYLNVDNNQLQRMPDTLPDSLAVLSADHNQLRRLPARLPEFLQCLMVAHNQLKRLQNNLPCSLTAIGVNNNQLTHLLVCLPVSLRRLNVAHNQLTCLPKDLPQCLEELDVNYNQLTHLSERLPEVLRRLNAQYNRLRHLPDNLPDLLEQLYVNHNQLTYLPDNLPDSLDEIAVDNNQLTRLPNCLPRALQLLHVAHNQLTCLPDNLPASLHYFDVDHNQLTHLPAHLPASLRILFANNNQLTRLPETMPPSLEVLNVYKNQLTRLSTLPQLLKTLNVRDNRLTYLPENLPSSLIRLDVHGNSLIRLPQTLPPFLEIRGVDMIWLNHQAACANFLEAILLWHPESEVKRWEIIYRQMYARDFGTFLKKLRLGKNNNNAALRHRLAKWLDYLAKDGHGLLRKDTFWLANEAAENCTDRASYYFTHMHILMVEHQLLNAAAPVSQVIETIRGNFRLQILEEIAAKHVAKRRAQSPNFVEDLEIYFAYQYKLRDALSLPVYTELQFDGLADLSHNDLNAALKAVFAAEESHFMCYWLTESALWTAILEKWNAKKMAVEKAYYLETLSSDDFSAKVEKELIDKGIPANDTDAERGVRKYLAEQLFYKLRYQLTQEYLAQKHVLSLLYQYEFNLPSLSRRGK